MPSLPNVSNVITEENILRNFGGVNYNSLLKVLNYDDENESHESEIDVIKHSPYFSHEGLLNELSSQKGTFSVLSLNAQSIRAKHDSLSLFIARISEIDFEFSVICIQET